MDMFNIHIQYPFSRSHNQHFKYFKLFYSFLTIAEEETFSPQWVDATIDDDDDNINVQSRENEKCFFSLLHRLRGP